MALHKTREGGTAASLRGSARDAKRKNIIFLEGFFAAFAPFFASLRETLSSWFWLTERRDFPVRFWECTIPKPNTKTLSIKPRFGLN